MRFRKSFLKILKTEFPGTYQKAIAEIEQQYINIAPDTDFALRSSNPLDKRLDFSSYFLAMIQTLESRGTDFNSIKRIALAVARDFVTPKNHFQTLLKRLPAKLLGFRLTEVFLHFFNKKVSHNGHPNGFRANILTKPEDNHDLSYGIDILECGICKLFEKHNAKKYAVILCEVDKITSNLAGLELIRTGTIAGGAEKCDFRFKRK